MSAVSNSPIRLHPKQGGMTLIEVLVALLVLSIGLLGVAGLQWQALRSNHGAHLRSQATILAHDIADRMRANRTEAEDGAYAVDIGEIPTGETLADFDVVAWKQAIADILPAGDGAVEMVSSARACPTGTWRGSRSSGPIGSATISSSPKRRFEIRHAQVKQLGLSLVELMVAMALAVLLMTGVLSIFQSSKVTYLTNEKTARLQENGRVALELMMYDLRSAGYEGCARESVFTTTLNDSTDVPWNYAQPVQGFESQGDGDFLPALALALAPVPVPRVTSWWCACPSAIAPP